MLMMPMMLKPLLLGTLFTFDAAIESQHLRVTLDPATHEARVTADITTRGEGTLTLQLSGQARDIEIASDSGTMTFVLSSADDIGEYHIIQVAASAPDPDRVRITYRAHFEQDVQAGEVAGQIHNKSVSAHVGENGIFLSDGSAWHPRWVDKRDRTRLMTISVEVEPIDGWSIVCSGDPVAHLRSLSEPVWTWETPRPVDGMAIVGNRHTMTGESHGTAFGPVDIVMHTTAEHEDLAPMFIEAAKSYLDLYVPRLGPFPYRRFSIVENFFSSGFAYPGFTVLGPQVVGMAPRSLAPGYLDHELVHNWWGNGVYVDPDDGNWCEALTSYCANYFRRIAEDGEGAGRAYRRGILMKLSTDPDTLDNGAMDLFGRRADLDRLVGYDKGSFIFSMLEGGGAYVPVTDDRAAMFRALKRFAEDNLGTYAGWDDLQASFEAEFDVDLSDFFDRWVRRHTVPHSDMARGPGGADRFNDEFGASVTESHLIAGSENGRSWIEVDPEFRLYRVLPPEHLVPTIAGTLGPGGVRVNTFETRSEVSEYLPRLSAVEDGENLVLIGAATLAEQADLVRRAADPITLVDDGFTVGGVTYDRPGQAVLHTMGHPDHPGRYITVFLSNGEAGWSRLRLIGFYTRDTTIVWEDEQVLERRNFEPDRRFWLD